MQPSPIEVAFGSFVPDGRHHFRILSAEDFLHSISGPDAARLAARGLFPDPFFIGSRFGPQSLLRIAAEPEEEPEVVLAADLPPEDDPFDVADLIEAEVEWAEADYAHYQKSVGADRQSYDLNASLGAADCWLAVRDPFRVTTRGRQGQ